MRSAARVEAPGTKLDTSGPFEIGKALRHVAAVQLHKAYAEIQHAFSRFGVPVFCATERDPVDRVLQRMRRLRVQERGVR